MTVVAPRIHSIPTMYRGVKMRSRLEARWAAMFDELAWPWLYEPIDLAGYIPDFILRFPTGDMLAEVKPELRIEGLSPSCAKIDASGWGGEALVVGAHIHDAGSMHPIIGRQRDAYGWDVGVLFRCLRCHRVSVLNEAGSWKCRNCGACDDRSHVGLLRTGDGIADMWTRAGNKTQWRPE